MNTAIAIILVMAGLYIYGPSLYRTMVLDKSEGDMSEYEGKEEPVLEDTCTNS